MRAGLSRRGFGGHFSWARGPRRRQSSGPGWALRFGEARQATELGFIDAQVKYLFDDGGPPVEKVPPAIVNLQPLAFLLAHGLVQEGEVPAVVQLPHEAVLRELSVVRDG